MDCRKNIDVRIIKGVLFAMYEVPNNLKRYLLLSHSTGQAKSIISKLPLDQLCDYKNVRKFLFNAVGLKLASKPNAGGKFSKRLKSWQQLCAAHNIGMQ